MDGRCIARDRYDALYTLSLHSPYIRNIVLKCLRARPVPIPICIFDASSVLHFLCSGALLLSVAFSSVILECLPTMSVHECLLDVIYMPAMSLLEPRRGRLEHRTNYSGVDHLTRCCVKEYY